MRRAKSGWPSIALAMGLALGACTQPVDLALPTVEQVKSHYTSDTPIGAEMSGNVAVVIVEQSAGQLRRGGTLWARVGPYIYLFSDETRQLFEDYPGLAGVRVITRTATGNEIARALLARDELSDILWRRSLNISGLARRDGTEHPGLLDDLTRWGEAHTEHAYNKHYTG
jgi:hypothetical protein